MQGHAGLLRMRVHVLRLRNARTRVRLRDAGSRITSVTPSPADHRSVKNVSSTPRCRHVTRSRDVLLQALPSNLMESSLLRSPTAPLPHRRRFEMRSLPCRAVPSGSPSGGVYRTSSGDVQHTMRSSACPGWERTCGKAGDHLVEVSTCGIRVSVHIALEIVVTRRVVIVVGAFADTTAGNIVLFSTAVVLSVSPARRLAGRPSPDDLRRHCS